MNAEDAAPARTKAEAHFARTGAILPGHAGDVADFLKRRREAAREEEAAYSSACGSTE
jgi:hypothetical protein